MNITDLGCLLASSTKKKHLSVSIPLLGMSFASNNAQYLESGFKRIKIRTALFVRQFTSLQSEVPFKTDSTKYLPIKNLAAFILDPLASNGQQVVPLSQQEAKDAYSIDDAGVFVGPPRDLIFFDGYDFLKRLE